MAWKIGGLVEPHRRSGVDASGWLWEIRDNGNARRVLVEVTGTAHAVNETTLPNDTLEALRTEGRSEVEKVLGLSDPPKVVLCGTAGCHREDPSS
jgi:hypothetical protein